MPKLIRSRDTFQILQLIAVVGLVAVVGVMVLVRVFAAGTPVAIEPENGTLAGGATVATVAGASGAGAVKFDAAGPTPTGVPPACAGGGAYLWSNLVTCGWPGASNTGVPSGTNLTNAAGRTISVAGTVIDGQNITGAITVNAANVIIRNSRINYTGPGGGGSGAVKILANASATIENVEINGQIAVHSCIWHEGSALTVRKVNCHHVEDGMFSWAQNTGSAISGDNFLIEDSYIHDLGGNESNGHLDGWQTEGAANGVIRHNTFYTTPDGTSLIAIWNSQKNSHDITVENNLFAGGGFSIYAQDYHPTEASPAGGNTVTKIHVLGNKFSTALDSCVGGFGVWFFRSGWQPYQGGPTDGWNVTAGGSNRSGNRILETGYNLDNGNPPGCS